MLIVYTGNGKGKSTAAIGLAFRALGRDMTVAVVQFIKGKWKTGERTFAQKLGLDWFVMGQGFTWESEDLSRDKRAAVAAWEQSKEMMKSHQIVILDEITYAINYSFISLDDVLETLKACACHVVVTGRNAPEALVAQADLVTEMKSIRHPFERGEKAVAGLDF